MEDVKELFRQKMLWIGFVLVAVIVLILSTALMGPTVSPTPKELPVMLVMEDAGAKLPNGAELNYGKLIQQTLMEDRPVDAAVPTIKWKEANASEVSAALDRQDAYAALILPADLTQRLLSIATPQAASPEVELRINQGMNAVGANAAVQVAEKTVAAVNAQLRSQLSAQIKERGDSLNTAQAAALAAPLQLKETIVHPIAANTAGGNAPVALTQLVWMAALISSVVQLQASRKVRSGERSYSLVLGQIGTGLLFGLLGVAAILLLNIHVIGLDIPDFWPVAGFLLLAFCAFFLIQAAVLQYVGLVGMPLLFILFFFGLPVLSLPYEALPHMTRSLLFSWVPFRFSVEGLRDLFYFRQNLGWQEPARILSFIGTGGLLFLGLSPLVFKRRERNASPALSLTQE